MSCSELQRIAMLEENRFGHLDQHRMGGYPVGNGWGVAHARVEPIPAADNGGVFDSQRGTGHHRIELPVDLLDRIEVQETFDDNRAVLLHGVV